MPDEQQLALDEARAAPQAAARLGTGRAVPGAGAAEALQRRGAAVSRRLPERPSPARDVRLNYARLLVNDRNFQEARKQFEMLLREFPQQSRRDAWRSACCRCSARTTTPPKAQLQARARDRLQGSGRGAPLPRPGQRGAQALRRGAQVVWRGRAAENNTSTPRRVTPACWRKQGRLADARKYLQEVSPQNNAAARAVDAGRGAAAARRQRLSGGVRSARRRARKNCPTRPTCSTTRRWRRRRSTAWTCSSPTCAR